MATASTVRELPSEKPEATAIISEMPTPALIEDSPDAGIERKLQELGTARGAYIYPLFIGEGLHIDADMVDDVYDSLTSKCRATPKIEVLINSGGGDLHAAYSLGLLLRRFGSEHLRFIVPRWAKSAATLLVCAGDIILHGARGGAGAGGPADNTNEPDGAKIRGVLPATH